MHNAIGLARHIEYCSVMCTVVKCSQALVELFAGHLESHCMYFALYCISASIGADTAEVGGIKRA